MRFPWERNVLIARKLGYLSMPAEDASALFHFVATRIPRGSVVLATNRGGRFYLVIDHDFTSMIVGSFMYPAYIVATESETIRLANTIQGMWSHAATQSKRR